MMKFTNFISSIFNSKFLKINSILFFEGILFSILTIFVTANIKIINPRNTDWLSVGDGMAELSWEFFRNQPIFQFPLGLNPNYGLEISSTMAFDGQIPLFSLLLHPLSPFLPDRFQYFGLFLLLTFTLNFYFSAKIFLLMKMTHLQILLNSSILSLSPIILHRFIDHTHYALTAAWIIFWAIYLCLHEKSLIISWIIVFNLTALIHFYYFLFVFTLFFFLHLEKIIYKKESKFNFAMKILVIFVSLTINMYLVGYFYGDVSSQDVGFGIFRTTLISFFDSSGWSILFKDVQEPFGAYEGFAYLGTATILLIIFNIFLLLKKIKVQYQPNLNAKSIWISSIVLSIFALSNKIAFANIELFEYRIPNFLNLFTNTFRSSGRYVWLLVFFIFIWTTFNIFIRLEKSKYTLLLTIVLLITLVDNSKQLISQKNDKFSYKNKTDLTNVAWKELNKCYKYLRIYPPVPGVDNAYNFLELTSQLNMGINTARLSRFSQNEQDNAFAKIHKQIQKGEYEKNSFYVFSYSQFVPKDITDYYKNFAIKTIDNKTSWGILNGYTFIAPNIVNCKKSNKILNESISVGPLANYIYKGGIIRFGINKNNENYILTSFSQLYDWGVTTVDSSSTLTLNIDPNLNLKNLFVSGTTFEGDGKFKRFSFELNGEATYDCLFSNLMSTCQIDISNFRSSERILSIRIIPTKDEENKNIPKLALSSIELK